MAHVSLVFGDQQKFTLAEEVLQFNDWMIIGLDNTLEPQGRYFLFVDKHRVVQKLLIFLFVCP